MLRYSLSTTEQVVSGVAIQRMSCTIECQQVYTKTLQKHRTSTSCSCKEKVIYILMIEVNKLFSFSVAIFSTRNRKHVLRVSVELQKHSFGRTQKSCGNTCLSTCVPKTFLVLPNYLTVRLFAIDFYEVIVDEAEGRINYHLLEIESK